MDGLLPGLLFLFGLGFLTANLLAIVDLVRYRRRKRFALLVWHAKRPRFFGVSLGLGVILGLLLVFRIGVQQLPPSRLFGEAMMFIYYGYVFPLRSRISRGFYRDGVWSDTAFMPWSQISAVSWKEGEAVTLVLISHARNLARRLEVPGNLYGQARRVLRDRIKAHDIHLGGSGLDLGSREKADAV